MTYKLVDDEQLPGQKILSIDGKGKCCPFQMPLALPGVAGTSRLTFRGCGTWCALFHVHSTFETKPLYKVLISCTGVPITYTCEREVLPDNISIIPSDNVG